MSLHKCEDHECPCFAQSTTRGCGCHQTDEQVLRGRIGELAEVLQTARDDIEAIATGWLIPVPGAGPPDRWEHSARQQLARIDAVLAKIGIAA